jgi:hypothetical protein
MNEQTISILRRFSRILEVTAAYLELPRVQLVRLQLARATRPQLGMKERRHG